MDDKGAATGPASRSTGSKARRAVRRHRPARRSLVAGAIAAGLLVAAGCGGSTTTTADPAASTTAVSTDGSSTTAAGPTTTGSDARVDPADDFTPAPIAWKACDDAGYECATVPVPLDYTKPDGRKISLAVKRHQATGTERIGSLFFNPGGPGSSGVESLPDIITVLSDDVVARFDVVSWDPRGIGESTPVKCDDGAVDLYSTDLTRSDPLPDVDLAAKGWAEECQANSGDLLPFVGTTDTTRDLETLRKAVGDEKLNYLGVSYGTEIGLVYAERWPTHIRAMVLDGIVDPTQDPNQANLEQSTTLDESAAKFIEQCNADPDCPLAPDAAAKLDELREVARSGTLEGTVLGSSVTLSPTFTDLAVIAATYDSSTWPALARAIDAALSGNPAGLNRFLDAYFSGTSTGANAAIGCMDGRRPTEQEIDALLDTATRQAPRFGPLNANGNRVCLNWPVEPKPVPTSYRAAGSPTIMIWGTTGDNATPYQNAYHIAQVLENARLVTLEANRHAALGANACVKRTQGAYLVDLTVPPEGTRC